MLASENQSLLDQRLPSQPHELEVLRKRAIHLAVLQKQETQTDDEMFLHVQLANEEHYGIPYLYLDEILRPRPITPIPNTSGAIAGTIPYRGELIAVLDLGQLLDISEADQQDDYDNAWMVVVKTNNMFMALLVNEVHGNFHYRPESLSHSLNTTLEAPNAAIQGIFDGKIAILDLSTLLTAARLKLEKRI